MKRIILLLFCLMAFTAQAQLTLIIHGTVTDSTQNPGANVAVHIDSLRSTPSGTLPTFGYSNMVMTNAAGEYVDTISVPGGVPQGGLNVWLVNCHGDTVFNIAAWGNAPGTTTIVNINFNYCPSSGTSNPTVNDRITGVVAMGNMMADAARVWLIEHNSTAGTLTAVDSMDVFASGGTQGVYYFENLDTAAEYRVKAALLPTSAEYANYLPTYHDTALYWSNAIVIQTPTAPMFGNPIYLQAGVNPGGPGFIGGLISAGANKMADPGDPLANISVLLISDNNIPVTHTVTNANGEFSFSNIAYGTYKVHVEIPGKTGGDAFVTIGPSAPSVSTVNFAVNTSDITSGIGERSKPEFRIVIYPTVTDNNVFIKLDTDEMVKADVQVISIDGKMMVNQSHQFSSGSNEINLDLTHLPAGIYFIKLTNNDWSVNERLIKINP